MAQLTVSGNGIPITHYGYDPYLPVSIISPPFAHQLGHPYAPSMWLTLTLSQTPSHLTTALFVNVSTYCPPHVRAVFGRDLIDACMRVNLPVIATAIQHMATPPMAVQPVYLPGMYAFGPGETHSSTDDLFSNISIS
jgi:hypothetical protein